MPVRPTPAILRNLARSRNTIAVTLLALLGVMAFFVLGSLLGDLGLSNPSQPTRAIPTVVGLATPSPATVTSPVPTLRATAPFTRTATAPSPMSLTATPSPTRPPTATPAATLSPAPSPTLAARTWLVPFRQVLGLNENSLAAGGQVWLYEGYNDIFGVVQSQGPNVHLESENKTARFWVSQEALSAVLPPAPFYDYTVRGQVAVTRSPEVLACSYNASPTLAFGLCSQLANVGAVTLIAAVGTGDSRMYLVELNGQQYFLASSDVMTAPGLAPTP